jgi:hypothetical protein
VKTHRALSSRRHLLGLAAGLCAVVSASGAVPPPSREDAARLRVKVEAIERNSLARRPAALVTRVSEREVNAYLAFDAKSELPAGFTEPRITVLPDLLLSGTATIDLDALRKERQSRSWLDPLNYLGGKVAVAVSGRLTSSNGLARFALDRATVGGITVPKMLVQELVTFYSRTPDNPHGLNLDAPYPLPARIRQIDIRPGEAIVRQ